MVRGGEIGVFGGALVRLHCGAQVDAALLWGPEGPAVPKREGASSRGWLRPALPRRGRRVRPCRETDSRKEG